jgi:NADPH:quinone reductase-like Zn-dependent oxidoreductase
MKAIVYEKYGPPDVLQLKEVEKPAPKDNEVRVKVHATAVTSRDVRFRAFKVPASYWLFARIVFGFRKPKRKILGSDLAGEIESVGKNVTRFKMGDQVFGTTTELRFGAYAEYVCLPEEVVLAIKPANMGFEEAAAVHFGANTALYFLRKGDVQSSETYDVIFDAVGKSSFSDCIGSLKENGTYLQAVLAPSGSIRGLWTSMTSSKKVIGGTAIDNSDDLIFLRELIEAEKIKPVIDRRYPLEQMAEAHSYVDKGHKKGNVVIAVEHNNST